MNVPSDGVVKVVILKFEDRRSQNKPSREVAKWLHQLGADIHVGNECAFRWTCKHGHIEVAKWLYELGANIHAINGFVFKQSPKNIIDWLNTLQ